MINSILSSKLREQAGANTYNRYEYQMHWIVNYIINKIERDEEFLIFCEYHDDMAGCEKSPNPSAMEFYQIKTSDDNKEWKLKQLFRKHKRENGTYKNSFMGFIFYNFKTFNLECSKCHFVSNKHFDDNIRLWQSIVKDGNELRKIEPDLYQEIRGYLRNEYGKLDNNEFDIVFERFIQNTFLDRSSMPLENYEDGVKGRFYDALGDPDISVGSAKLIYDNLVDEVRKKGKHIIKTPVSYIDLKKEKGISSDTFTIIKNKFRYLRSNEKMDDELKEFLSDFSITKLKKNSIINKLQKHKIHMMNVQDSLYIDIIEEFRFECKKIARKNYETIEGLADICEINSFIKELIKKTLDRKHPDIDEDILKGIYYEQILIESNNMLQKIN